MTKKKKWRAYVLYSLEKLAHVLFFPVLLVILTLLANALFDGTVAPKDKASLIGSLTALVLSAIGFYLTVLRPFFRRPRLELSTNTQWSAPTYEEEQTGDKGSWFIRLRIVNNGQTPAKSCVGRLIEVRTAEKKRLEKFDPLSLYWARQNEKTGFSPIDIQGYGDFFFLDVAKFTDKEADSIFSLRAVIPSGKRLITESGQPPDVGLNPESYFVRIGIYADGAYIKPTWFKIAPPDYIEQVEKPTPAK